MGAPGMWRQSVRVAVAVALQYSVVGCSGPRPDLPQPTPAPSAAAEKADLPAVVLPDGRSINLELALTAEEITQGLMFRPALPQDRGMLFVFDQERRPSFWMKNTLIPLDLVFLGGNGTIVDVIADAQPCAADPCPQYIPSGPARAVLEINAGAAQRHGLVAGSRLRFEKVPGYPVAE